MGALHEGHAVLVRTAAAECKTTVASVFVNPTQFNDPADLAAYPRTLDADLGLLQACGCDVAFVPSVEEVYGDGTTTVRAGKVAERWEGEHRPGHFDGVATVVAKLFGAVGPCIAYFGTKDLQQCSVIRDMVASLLLPVGIRLVPTVREPSGLAMSSRNSRLSAAGRSIAPCIYRVLSACAESLCAGESVEEALDTARSTISQEGVSVQYLALVDPLTMEPQDAPQADSHLVFAGFVEGIRLIDNVPVFTNSGR